MAIEARPQGGLTLLLSAGGFLAGLLMLVGMDFPGGSTIVVIAFSALLGRFLDRRKLLRGNWGWLIIAATVANFLSPLLAFGVQLLYPPPGGHVAMNQPVPVSPIALFAGGAFGGLVIIGALACLERGIGTQGVLLRAALGCLSGGVLGALGMVLAPTIGNHVWYFLHSMHLTRFFGPQDALDPGDVIDSLYVYSLYVVWPTGIALVMSLTLRGIRAPS